MRNDVLIETLWNVKMFTVEQYTYKASVLIETLWNVKQKVERYIRCRKCVLIETLWNVKYLVSFFIFAGCFCINRNIVECKVKCFL